MSDTSKENLTEKEKDELQIYLDELDKLYADEPVFGEHSTEPEEYIDQKTGQTYTKTSDPVYEAWNKKLTELNEKYYDIVVKALMTSFSDWQDDANLTDMLRYILSDRKTKVSKIPPAALDLLNSQFVLLLNSELLNAFFTLDLSSKNFKIDKHTGNATLNVGDVKIVIPNYEAIKSGSVGIFKILDEATAFLTMNNFYDKKHPTREEEIILTVEIPFKEYAALRKEDISTPANKRNFKRKLRKDISALSTFTISGTIKKGKNSGDCLNLGLISPEFSVTDDFITMTFLPTTAKVLLDSHEMWYSQDAQGLDERNPNLYPAARKLMLQSSIDNNNISGNANTLKVSTIINSLPKFTSIEQLKKRGSRNWIEKVKVPFEKILDQLVKNGTILRWQYRDARTGDIISRKRAETLSMDEYNNLDVDYSLKDNQRLVERGLKKAEEAEKALASPASDPPKTPKKRGRPKKNQ